MVDTSRSMLALLPSSRIVALLLPLAAASLLLLPLASPAAGHVDPRAADFASHGFTETIAVCRLPDTCAGRRPLVSRKEPVRETGNDNIVEEHLVDKRLRRTPSPPATSSSPPTFQAST